MKRVFFIALFCTVHVLTFAQLTNEQKIIDVYGTEWYNRMQAESPDLLNLMDKYASYGFMLKQVSPGKYSEFVPLEFVPLTGKDGTQVTVSEFLADYNGGNFNPLKYQFFPGNEYQVYKLKGVDYIIYILPQASVLQGTP